MTKTALLATIVLILVASVPVDARQEESVAGWTDWHLVKDLIYYGNGLYGALGWRWPRLDAESIFLFQRPSLVIWSGLRPNTHICRFWENDQGFVTWADCKRFIWNLPTIIVPWNG
jgi:hypothetical protein